MSLPLSVEYDFTLASSAKYTIAFEICDNMFGITVLFNNWLSVLMVDMGKNKERAVITAPIRMISTPQGHIEQNFLSMLAC